MKRRAYILLIVVILAIIGYWATFVHSESAVSDGPKQQPLKVRMHSALFNNGIDSLLGQYTAMKDAFVKNDTLNAKIACANMVVVSDTLHLDELNRDTAGIFSAAQMLIGNLKGNAQSLLADKDITSMRKDFKMISESLYPLLKAIHYDGKSLYWQNCPMAFGDGNDANWISNTAEIKNPYLGKKDITMYHCGETKDSIIGQ